MGKSLADLRENDVVILRYIVCAFVDLPPKGKLERLTYYTELQSRPNEIYYKMSYRRPTPNEELQEMLRAGHIVKVLGDVIFPFTNDVFLNAEGEALFARGYAPWEGTVTRIMKIK